MKLGTCKICGKQTFEGYTLCPQCNNASKGKSGKARAKNKPQTSEQSLSPDYLKNGYFDENGYLREEIFTSEAMHVSDVLSSKGMTSAAIRRFYTKLRGISNRYGTGDFERIKEKLYSFYPSAAYAVSRKNTSVPPEFQKFIETNIKLAVKDPKHFKGFVEHFQSVVAYFKEKDNRRRR